MKHCMNLYHTRCDHNTNICAEKSVRISKRKRTTTRIIEEHVNEWLHYFWINKVICCVYMPLQCKYWVSETQSNSMTYAAICGLHWDNVLNNVSFCVKMIETGLSVCVWAVVPFQVWEIQGKFEKNYKVTERIPRLRLNFCMQQCLYPKYSLRANKVS